MDSEARRLGPVLLTVSGGCFGVSMQLTKYRRALVRIARHAGELL